MNEKDAATGTAKAATPSTTDVRDKDTGWRDVTDGGAEPVTVARTESADACAGSPITPFARAGFRSNGLGREP